MTLVAWILSLAGAGLAVWFTLPELLRAVQAGTPARGLVFVGGPFVLGTLTLLAVLRAYRRQPASRV
jgi:hypothetical protein